MGVRPPQGGDGDDAPKAVAFGIAALDDHLERASVQFPATDEELLDALDDPAVPYDASGNTLHLSEVLDRVDNIRFETRQEFLNAIHPVFEAERERATDGFLGTLRSLIPF